MNGGIQYEAPSTAPKVYAATFIEAPLQNPVVTQIRNDFGGTPLWSRVALGDYLVNITGAFPAGKTLCFTQTGDVAGIGGGGGLLNFIRIDNDNCELISYDVVAGVIVPADYSSNSPISLKIEVYP